LRIYVTKYYHDWKYFAIFILIPQKYYINKASLLRDFKNDMDLFEKQQK